MNIYELASTLKKKKLIVILGIIILALAFVYVFLSRRPPSSNNTGVILPPIEPTRSSSPPVFSIGQDTFSKTDKEYLTSVYLPGTNPNDLTASDEAKLRNVALEKTVVIQEAIKKHLISVNDTIYQPNKDWQKYNEMYEKAKQAVIKEEEQMSVEGIYMFFYNQTPPAIGTGQAKQLTKAKMENIRTKLVDKTLTVQGAVDQIRADSELSQIDPIYQSNVYAKFENKNRSFRINDGLSEHDIQLIWDTPLDGYTPVLLGTESGNGLTPNEAFWVIYHVMVKKTGGKPYLEWLEMAKKTYEIKSL